MKNYCLKQNYEALRLHIQKLQRKLFVEILCLSVSPLIRLISCHLWFDSYRVTPDSTLIVPALSSQRLRRRLRLRRLRVRVLSVIFFVAFLNCTFLVSMVLFLFLYIISMLIIRTNIFLQIICESGAYLFTVTAYKIHYNHRHERVESLDPRTLPLNPRGVLGFSVFV